MAAPGEVSGTRTEPGLGVEPEFDPPLRFLAPGQLARGRYEIRSLLGRGEMGEVWRAFDLKLRVDVALKALRRELFTSEVRLELLRQEVWAARVVVSPNVCRVFDLIELEGRELVSMEYIDGRTLLEVLKERGPFDLKEAQEIASQFLAGLEAIHRAGLIHRDLCPKVWPALTWVGSTTGVSSTTSISPVNTPAGISTIIEAAPPSGTFTWARS